MKAPDLKKNDTSFEILQSRYSLWIFSLFFLLFACQFCSCRSFVFRLLMKLQLMMNSLKTQQVASRVLEEEEAHSRDEAAVMTKLQLPLSITSHPSFAQQKPGEDNRMSSLMIIEKFLKHMNVLFKIRWWHDNASPSLVRSVLSYRCLLFPVFSLLLFVQCCIDFSDMIPLTLKLFEQYDGFFLFLLSAFSTWSSFCFLCGFFSSWSTFSFLDSSWFLGCLLFPSFSFLVFVSLFCLCRDPSILELYRRQYQYILCDEYQDVSCDQLQLLVQLCERSHHITVCGDDDQSIYGWRGVSVKSFDLFFAHFPGHSNIVLEETYRSTGKITHAVDSIIRHNVARTPKNLRTANKPGVSILAPFSSSFSCLWPCLIVVCAFDCCVTPHVLLHFSSLCFAFSFFVLSIQFCPLFFVLLVPSPFASFSLSFCVSFLLFPSGQHSILCVSGHL